jgi:beta-N-acetylhexosaminidase
MSPPLPQQPPLAQLVASVHDEAVLKAAVRDYAAIQGRGLASMGVNLNFAPVVDLNHQVVNPSDRFSRIYQRAIASDPKIVAFVAETYCRGIRQEGVRCTLKHFPGLGRIFEDTHRDNATLTTPVSLLEQTDWVPFRDLLGKTDAFTMLGHVKLPEIDPLHPVSFSQPVVGQILRGRWRHQGVLITDDFSMGAVYNSDEGVGGAAVAALNAGVDLILISFDPDLYYGVMGALLTAARENRLDWAMLNRSSARLEANRDF